MVISGNPLEFTSSLSLEPEYRLGFRWFFEGIQKNF